MKDPDSISIAELQALSPPSDLAPRGIRTIPSSSRNDGGRSQSPSTSGCPATARTSTTQSKPRSTNACGTPRTTT